MKKNLILIGWVIGFFILIPQVHAAITITATSTCPSNGPGTACSAASTATAGDLLVLSGCTANSATLTVTSTNPSIVWNTAVSQNDGVALICTIFYAMNIPAGKETSTLSSTSGARNTDGALIEYSGIKTTNALDVSTSTINTNVTTFTSGTSTVTTNANEVAVGFVGTRISTQTWTPVGGYTSEVTVNDAAGPQGVNLQDLILSSTGAQNSSWTAGTQQTGPGLIATFIGTAAASGATNANSVATGSGIFNVSKSTQFSVAKNISFFIK